MMRFVCPTLFVTSSGCMSFKVIGYDSASLNGIVADKSHRVIPGLYDKFCGYLKI